MEKVTAVDTPVVAEALERAAALAGYAPSVFNTQPWRWTVLADRLELSAVRERQLGVTDSDGRLLVVSCGAALHHARMALAAVGWECTVSRRPDPGRVDLLAVITPTAYRTADPAAVRPVQAMKMRHTDRRPLSAQPVSDDAVRAISEAVRGEGAYLHVLTGDQVYDLAAAAYRAGAVEETDEAAREEMAYWVARGDGFGVPAYTLPETQPASTVPARDFGQPGTLPVGPGHDRAAAYGVLYSDGDVPLSWLRAGEALSAAWLTAGGLGVSVLPLSAVIEVAVTRVALRRLLVGLGWPYLVLWLGIADPDHAGPANAPRLGTPQIVDSIEVRHLLDRD